jgi:phage terminase large subunit
VTETTALAEDEVAEMKLQMTPNQFAREMLVSFDAPVEGSYYGDLIVDAQAEGRICSVPYDPAASVVTSWDLGMHDKTAIWFLQRIGRELHLIDYLEDSGKALDWYVKQINMKKYAYAGHILPHDIRAREYSTGRARFETLEALGLNITICPNHAVEDGIAAVRSLLPICWFDEKRTGTGVTALKSYQAAPAPSLGTTYDRALKNWARHGSDSLRYMAMGIDRVLGWESAGRRSFKGFRVPNIARRA